jgi:hypothetical protein
MVALGNKKAALGEAAACSVKVVAGACTHLYRTLVAWGRTISLGSRVVDLTIRYQLLDLGRLERYVWYLGRRASG